MERARFKLSRRWLAACIAVGLLLLAPGFTSRAGLYNNRSNDRAAADEHEAAWLQRFASAETSRLEAYYLIRSFGGSCITGEANWETVHLDERLDRFLGRAGITIDCHVDVRGSFPFNFLSAYRWTTVLEPVSADRVRLKGTRRQRDTL